MESLAVGAGLKLRTFTLDDADELFMVLKKNRSHLRPWLEWVDGICDPSDATQIIVQWNGEYELQQGVATGIFLENRLLGCLTMSDWDQQLKKATVGYWIDHEWEGRGVVMKCLASFMDFLFSKAALEKLEFRFIARNARSEKLVIRIGCTIEAVLRKGFWLHGRAEDLVIVGLFRHEWEAARKMLS